MKRLTWLPAAALLALVCTHCFADAPSADQLYASFKSARTGIVIDGPPGALNFYSRQWLVDGITDLFESSERRNDPIAHIKGTLWSKFASLAIVSAVYSYEMHMTPDGRAVLEIKLTTNLCGKPGEDRPSLEAYTFAAEDQTWRVVRIARSYLPKDRSWFSSDLVAIDRFAYVPFPDHSMQWNELFAALGSTRRVTDPCSQPETK